MLMESVGSRDKTNKHLGNLEDSGGEIDCQKGDNDLKGAVQSNNCRL